jgi:hypothetical protein
LLLTPGDKIPKAVKVEKSWEGIWRKTMGRFSGVGKGEWYCRVEGSNVKWPCVHSEWKKGDRYCDPALVEGFEYPWHPPGYTDQFVRALKKTGRAVLTVDTVKNAFDVHRDGYVGMIKIDVASVKRTRRGLELRFIGDFEK